jgi:predicted cupin superfamily sugar epimerase
MSAWDALSAEDVARLLDLSPHPEGGYYRETFRDPRRVEGRAVSTAIYYLLPAGQVSAWHRVDAAEIWHYHAGAPLELSLWDAGRRLVLRLGADLPGGERPQGIAPAGVWQSARSLGAWTLVGCTVAPGFEFAHFEMAPPGFPPVD